MKKNSYRYPLGSRRLGAALWALLLLSGCTGQREATGQGSMALTFTDAAFQKEVLESTEPVLVDFWAAWCGPCIKLAPTIEELAREYAGKVKVGKLNIDSEQAAARTYDITSIPTVVLFKGGKVVDRLVGGHPKENYRRLLDKGLEGGAATGR
ncbi:MAG TPA: thioredoxin [Planctomycetota bacterium]|nr:thioredoxin [Planctomycetota bacterium]